jgi:hypothetical protein
MEKAILLNNPIKNIVIPSGLVPKGAYDNSTDYAVGDYVTYLGTSYVMFLDAPAGTLPTDTTYWQILASKGNTGDSSPLWELDGTTLKPTDTSYLPTLLNSQSIYSNSDDTLIKNLSFYKSRGTYASPSVITTGDYLGEMVGYGHDGTNYIRSASIRFKSSGTIGTNRVPSDIEFYTSTNASPSVEGLAGAITSTKRLDWAGDIVSQSSILSYTYLQSARNGLATTSNEGVLLSNSTASLVGTPVQMSPRLRFRGSAWDTDDATSRTSDWIIENLPVSGATVSSTLRFGHSLAGGAYTYPMTLTSGGALTISGNLALPDFGYLLPSTSGYGYVRLGG